MNESRVTNVLLVIVAVSAVVSTGFTVVRGVSRGPTISELSSQRVVDVANWEQYAVGGQALTGTVTAADVVVFTDFQCPFCKRLAEEGLQQLRDSLGSKVSVVYRQFPLSTHRMARSLAIGSVCADSQGRFAEFHDLAFQKQDSLELISVEALARHAQVPDEEEFTRCTRGDSAEAVVQAGLDAGSELQLNGTPGVLIAGRLHLGAMTYAEMKRELTRE